jgi:hypothetical protein
MEAVNSLWWLILFIPLLGVGLVFGFFPHKVIQIRAKLQQIMFNYLKLSDENVDSLPIYSTLFGESYSKRLKSQQERPKEYRFLMIWSRIIGFSVLFISFITIWLIIVAVRTGNLIIR